MAGTAGQYPDTMTTPVTYLEYPDTLKDPKGVQHWIEFKGRDFKSGKTTLNIAMYMPNDALSTSYKSSYESTSLGSVGAQGQAVAQKMINNQGLMGSLEGLTEAFGAQSAATASESGMVTLLKGAEKAAGLNMGDTKTIMEQETGKVLNPYMVAAYKGPSDMREHKFTFTMVPQSEPESKTCLKIVQEFKKAMMPSHRGGDNGIAPSMLFGYPDQFEINYFINGDPLPDEMNPLFKIGKSVLTACDLNYTTQDVPLFFEGTQYPASIGMDLSFMELGVMYREKVEQGF